MKSILRLFSFITILLLACSAVRSADTPAGKPTARQIEAQAGELLAKMTTEEKVLQLLSYRPNGVPRLGIPHLEAGEVLHGAVTDGATCFPQSIALGATWDPELIGRIATVIAGEARAAGLHQGFAPMLGLARDPRWGRVEESYGEDPWLVSRIAVAYINGLQGQGADRFNRDHIIATPKHFVADGEPWAGANGEDYDVSERVLREIFMQPFEAAVKEAGTRSIMPGHHGLNGVPCHANSWLLDTVLRKEWGFDGFVTSDMGDIPKLAGGHKYVPSSDDAAVAALVAGVDMELVGNIYKSLPGSISAGKLSMDVLDRAALRVLKSKIELLGLSAPVASPAADSGASGGNTKQAITGYKGGDDIWAKLIAEGKFNTPENARRADCKEVLNDPAHDALALKAAEEAIVLLKNEKNMLPLDKNKIKRILVTGPLAKGRNVGGYSNGRPKFHIDVLDGLKAALPGAQIDYDKGCNLTDQSDADLAKTVTDAATADVIIAVVGHTRGQVGENLDRDNLDLIGGQEKLVESMQATGKPVVVVLQNGAPLTINWINDHVPAIVECLYLGQSTGTAIARVLFGEVNPGGRLPFTVPRTVGQVPCYYNHTPLHGPINYFQSKGGFLFPFGYGLSYTTFKYSDLTIEPARITPGQSATVSVTVENSGPRAGDEVVQLYIRQDFTSLKRPAKELKGFKRVTLKAGEKQTASFPIGFEHLKFWKGAKWVVEPGKINVMLGSSCEDIRANKTLELIPKD
jgi:beta-glucosidase